MMCTELQVKGCQQGGQWVWGWVMGEGTEGTWVKQADPGSGGTSLTAEMRAQSRCSEAGLFPDVRRMLSGLDRSTEASLADGSRHPAF